jgi:cobalamin biosynthesis protein CbiG
MNTGPETSRGPAGFVLPIPILPATSKIVELSRLHGLVNLARKLTEAAPSLVIAVQGVDVKNGVAVVGTAARVSLCELPDPKLVDE